MIACLLITDGRLDYLEQTMRTIHNLQGPITEWWMYDDSGDADHRTQLRELFPKFIHINRGPRQGFGGAINSAWQQVSSETCAELLLHIEADFTFDRPVDVQGMAAVLVAHPHLVQMALRRQPWNEAEKKAGGIVEMWPEEYQERSWEGYEWLEHRLFYTTNPHMIRMSKVKNGWPMCEKSERVYSDRCFQMLNAKSAFWGARDSGIWTTHIGNQRAGVGY